jgi:hypothetical protein
MSDKRSKELKAVDAEIVWLGEQRDRLRWLRQTLPAESDESVRLQRWNTLTEHIRSYGKKMEALGNKHGFRVFHPTTGEISPAIGSDSEVWPDLGRDSR